MGAGANHPTTSDGTARSVDTPAAGTGWVDEHSVRLLGRREFVSTQLVVAIRKNRKGQPKSRDATVQGSGLLSFLLMPQVVVK